MLQNPAPVLYNSLLLTYVCSLFLQVKLDKLLTRESSIQELLCRPDPSTRVVYSCPEHLSKRCKSPRVSVYFQVCSRSSSFFIFPLLIFLRPCVIISSCSGCTPLKILCIWVGVYRLCPNGYLLNERIPRT
jgi:hypothetical protein